MEKRLLLFLFIVVDVVVVDNFTILHNNCITTRTSSSVNVHILVYFPI